MIPKNTLHFKGFGKSLNFYSGKRFIGMDKGVSGTEFIAIDKFINGEFFIKREYYSQTRGLWEIFNYTTGIIKCYSVNQGENEDTEILYPSMDMGGENFEKYCSYLNKIRYYANSFIKEFGYSDLLVHVEYLDYVLSLLREKKVVYFFPVEFEIKEEKHRVSIFIYRESGEEIRRLINDMIKPVGKYQEEWDGCDDKGIPVENGQYYYVVQSGNSIEPGKEIEVRR